MSKRKVIFILMAIVILIISSYSLAGRIKPIAKYLADAPIFKNTLIRNYRHYKELFHKQRIDLPANGVKQSIKDVVNVVDAITPNTALAGSASRIINSNQIDNSLSPLYINPSVEGANIRIMNIRDKYKDGILLNKGDYEISIEKEGYRPKNFWVTLGENNQRNYEYSVDLQRTGLENCINTIELSQYNSGLIGLNGRVFQYKALFRNTNIHDLYYSFAMNEKSTNYTKTLSEYVTQNYAEFHAAQPTHLGSSDIEKNATIEINPDRFILLINTFEQVGNDVLYVNQGIMPAGVFVAETSKEWFCENSFNF